MEKINHILSLLLVAVLLLAAGVSRDGTLLGLSVEGGAASADSLRRSAPLDTEVMEKLGLTADRVKPVAPYIWRTSDGRIVYSSRPYGKDIIGYSGTTPLYIVLQQGRIVRVIPAANSETPSFFNRLYDQKLFERWEGMTLQEAAAAHVDAVSGATYSSAAVIRTLGTTASKVADIDVASSDEGLPPFGVKTLAALIVLAFGLYVVYSRRGRRWRMVQMVLNIAVFGLWTKTFLSLSLLTGWLSHGVNAVTSVVALVMLIMAVVIPFMGHHKHYYCTNVCPFGSAQELLGKVPVRKWPVSPQWGRRLAYVRRILLLVILVLMWTGVTFSLMDYEAFSIFLLDKADNVVIALGSAFLVLSLFVNRPYCRFVCPTGQVLAWSEGIQLRTKNAKTQK